MNQKTIFYETESITAKHINRVIAANLRLKYTKPRGLPPKNKQGMTDYCEEAIKEEIVAHKQRNKKISFSQHITMQNFIKTISQDGSVLANKTSCLPFDLSMGISEEDMNSLRMEDYLLFVKEIVSRDYSDDELNKVYCEIFPVIIDRFLRELPFYVKAKMGAARFLVGLTLKGILKFFKKFGFIPNQSMLILLVFGFCSKELKKIEVPESVQLEIKPDESFWTVLNFERVIEAFKNHLPFLIPDHLWELYQVIDFRTMFYSVFGLDPSEFEMVSEFSADVFLQIFSINSLLDSIQSARLRKKVVFDLFLADPLRTEQHFGFLSQKMLDCVKSKVMEIWHLDSLRRILIGNYFTTIFDRDDLKSIKNFEDTVDLDQPHLAVKLSNICKRFIKKNYNKRIVLSKQNGFEGKRFCSYPITEKINGEKDDIIGLDRSMKFIFDRGFKLVRGRRAYFNCIRGDGRKLFEFQNLKNTTSQNDLYVINVFPLEVVRDFENTRKTQISPIFLFYYERKSDENLVTIFHGRSKKILKTGSLKHSSFHRKYEDKRDLKKFLYDGSKLFFAINRAYSIDLLGPGSGLNLHKVSPQKMFVEEKDASKVSLGTPYLVIHDCEIGGVSFYSLVAQGILMKRILKSKVKYTFWQILPLGLFNLLFFWKEQQVLRLMVSDNSLKGRDLVIDLDIQMTGEDDQILPVQRVEILYKKLIIFFKDGVEWEVSFEDFEQEFAKLIEENNLTVHEERRVELDPKEMLIREYQQKIWRLEQKIEELSEASVGKQNRLRKDN